MSRPPLPLATAGKVGFTTMANGQVRARANFRDPDGVVRPVTRYGPSRAAAERRLKEAIRDRKHVSGDGRNSGDTRVRELGELWLAEIDAADLSDGTKDTYRRSLHNHVLKALGELRPRAARSGHVDPRHRGRGRLLDRHGAQRAAGGEVNHGRKVVVRSWKQDRHVL